MKFERNKFQQLCFDMYCNLLEERLMNRRIPDIDTFTRLAREGRCGNTPKVWGSLKEFASLAKQNEYCWITSRFWDQFRIYHQNAIHVRNLLAFAELNGGYIKHPSRPILRHIDDLIAMENPDPLLQASYYAFQFDYHADSRSLLYNVSNQPWGACKRAGDVTRASGASALVLLRDKLGEYYDDLEALGEMYKDSVIEATMFGWECGIYRRPLLIWEVRNY